ncbi:MAG: sensor domain-containing diguanylate cyclase [Acidobacteriota bacterium]|nr:sensor domain-containing diguanylate cyclase [Acidobacteriota bacterium]
MAQTSSRERTVEEKLDSARRQIRILEDRLARQQELHERLSEDHRFREVVIERAAEGVCVCHDVATHPYVEFTVWNQRMVELTGYQMEEINRLGWYQTVYADPEVRERARLRMERMREGHDLRFERWEIRHADGTERAIAISTSVLTAADGSVHVLALIHDLTEQENLRREALLARTDELTQLRNRRGFEEDAELLIRLGRRNHQCLTLGYLDLTNFKILNDEHGHQEGDRALQAIGACLSASVRSSDVIGRIGGDEFAIVLPATDAAGAKTFFAALEARLLDSIRAHGWDLGFGVGAATFLGHLPDLAEALRAADALMYEAKKSGKSNVVYGQFEASRESA